MIKLQFFLLKNFRSYNAFSTIKAIMEIHQIECISKFYKCAFPPEVHFIYDVRFGDI